MIFQEIPLKKFDDEFSRLILLYGGGELSDAFVSGAVTAIKWLKDGSDSPSELAKLICRAAGSDSISHMN